MRNDDGCSPAQTISKVLAGLGVGAMQFSLQLYITELSPTAKIRGTLLSCYNLWLVLSGWHSDIGRTRIDFKVDPRSIHRDDCNHHGDSKGSTQLENCHSHTVGTSSTHGNHLRSDP
jgi:hypothetical protein